MEPVATRSKGAAPARGVSPAELREAERGFKLMLARKFSAVWIAENARDLLAQANIEYTEWLKKNPPAENPVGWLLTCAYRRALNLLDTQTRKPRPASLDAVFHLADESTPGPEQQILDNDRQRRIREALGHLPDKERKLLALVYFEGYSIRAAGRKLGWQKSAADRHHGAAMEKMLALVGDRSLLSPASLGLAAWVITRSERDLPWMAPFEAILDRGREVLAIGLEAVSIGTHRGAEVWRRLSPISDPGNAAAASSAGRTVGYCAAAAGAVVCGLAATGVVGPGLSAHKPERQTPVRQRAVEAKETPAPRPASAPEPSRTPPPSEGTDKAKAQQTSPSTEDKQRSRRELPPRATGRQSTNEFGVERGSVDSPEPAPAPEASGGQSSSPAPKSSPGSAASTEFGL